MVHSGRSIPGGPSARLHQPRVVGEMIAGILIGHTVLGGRLAGTRDRLTRF
jgi:Kef-type K+ transport system membrane component KefB